MDEGRGTYTPHLGLKEELKMIEVDPSGPSPDVLVTRDVVDITFIELVDEVTLDVDGRLRENVLGDLLTGSDGSQLSTVVGLSLKLW
jgi:hypothetical protein